MSAMSLADRMAVVKAGKGVVADPGHLGKVLGLQRDQLESHGPDA
jgi:hypothetical protein